jgi:hypothetical protein
MAPMMVAIVLLEIILDLGDSSFDILPDPLAAPIVVTKGHVGHDHNQEHHQYVQNL